MSFHTLSYAFFLIPVFALYWAASARFRPWILLTAGYVYYAFAGPRYLLLLLYITGASFLFSTLMTKHSRLGHSRAFFSCAVALLLLPLIIYKALGFFDRNALIPVGLSFYTFQAVGYMSDVFTKRTAFTPSLLRHALFLSFFPQTLAGPIGRADALLPQLTALPSFSGKQACRGLRRFFWGLFKKLALADTLAANVDIVFAAPGSHHGSALLIAAVFYSLQIYCDFSAYSDMAIGTAALFGISLKENFRTPYFSASIREFWNRWHISLSTWLRDYIYIPLGGSRRGKLRSDVNLAVTFFLSGLWHGSGVTFIVWGLLHAGMQLLGRHLPTLSARVSLRPPTRAFLHGIRVVFTFLLVTAAWVFFRADTLSDAMVFFLHGADGASQPARWLSDGLAVFNDKRHLLLMLLLLAGVDFASTRRDLAAQLEQWPPFLRWGITALFFLFAWYMLPMTANHQFLYFAF